MDSPSDAHPGFLDAHGAIAEDSECKRCGYNLRGLKEDGRCPECGTPIGLSTQGDLLCFADPEWVEKVGHGMTIILWMMLIGVIIGALAGFLAAVGFQLRTFTAVLSLAAYAVSFYGVWLMTEPDPSGIGEDPNLTARKVIRITLIVGIGGQLASAVAQAAPGGGAPLTLLVTAFAAGLVGVVGEFAKYFYYEYLALRIPEVSLAERAHFLKWAYPIALGLVLVAGVAAGIMFKTSGMGKTGGPSGFSGGFMAFGCIGGLAGLALLVFGVMTIFLLIRLRRAVLEQAGRARETWATALEPAAPTG